MEKGFTQHLKSLPTPHLDLTVHTIASNCHDRTSPPEPLAFDGGNERGWPFSGQRVGSESTIEPESEQRKAEEII